MNAFAAKLPDVPSSEGMRNALYRARQLAELRWTPVKPLPAITSAGLAGVDPARVFLPAWKPQIGASYSAARFDEKYVGFNISLDTYMTALANPDSVLYTRSLHGKYKLCAAYYGTVCSEFVSYMLDQPFHIDGHQWPHMESVEKIDPAPLENLRLCDVLNKCTPYTPGHTAVITGINRDEAGRVVDITVTESVPPQVQVRTFTPEEFTGYWLADGYEVLRYGKLDQVTYTPSPWVHLEGDPQLERPVPNAVLMPDYGEKANYLLGETVTISVFDPAYTTVELCFGGEVRELPVHDGKAILTPETVGYYEAVAVSGTERSKAVEFCVVDAAATLDKEVYRVDEAIRPTFSCAAEDELRGWVLKTDAYGKYWSYPISDEGEIPTEVTLPTGPLTAGRYFIIGLYQNRYGLYSTPQFFFDVTE